MKSLTKAVAAAVDAAFEEPALSDFAPIADVHGDILRRYYRSDETAECEVCVYRDKWWTKAGGLVRADLYCLVSEAQQALGGCSQSWLNPDYNLPLEHFQYGLGKSAKNLTQEIRSAEDASRFAEALSQFLRDTALAWFAQFQSSECIANYLLSEGHFHSLARYRAHVGDREGAWTALKQYLESLPRQNEQELETLASCGLLEEEDCRFLTSAALQEQTEYERRVSEWFASRGSSE